MSPEPELLEEEEEKVEIELKEETFYDESEEEQPKTQISGDIDSPEKV